MMTYTLQSSKPLSFGRVTNFSGPSVSAAPAIPFPFQLFTGSVLDIFYEPTGGSPGTSTDEVLTVALG